MNEPQSRRVSIERPMRAPLVVVSDISLEQATQMSLVQNDHVIEQLATNASDQPLDVRVLPGRGRCGNVSIPESTFGRLWQAVTPVGRDQPCSVVFPEAGIEDAATSCDGGRRGRGRGIAHGLRVPRQQRFDLRDGCGRGQPLEQILQIRERLHVVRTCCHH